MKSRSSKHKSKMKFSKKVVTGSIIFIIIYTSVQTYLNYALATELSPTLTGCVYAFFGTELAATALIRIFDREDKKMEKEMEEKEYPDSDALG